MIEIVNSVIDGRYARAGKGSLLPGQTQASFEKERTALKMKLFEMFNNKIGSVTLKRHGRKLMMAKQEEAQYILVDVDVADVKQKRDWLEGTIHRERVIRCKDLWDSFVFRIGNFIFTIAAVDIQLPPRSIAAQTFGTTFLSQQLSVVYFSATAMPIYQRKKDSNSSNIEMTRIAPMEMRSTLTACVQAFKQRKKFDDVDEDGVYTIKQVTAAAMFVHKALCENDTHTLKHFEKFIPVWKETQNHHEHFRLSDVNWTAITRNDETKKARLFRAIMDMAYITDLKRPHFTGYLLWALFVRERAWNIYRHINPPLRGISSSVWAKTTKRNLEMIKSLSGLNFIDRLTDLFEVEVLVNRGIGEVDWETEKQNRTTPKLALVPLDFATTQLDRLFSQIFYFHHRKLRGQEWAKYWACRAGRVPSGSANSQYAEDLLLKKKFGRGIKKNVIVAAMPSERDFAFFDQRPPCIYAKAATKVEWGKKRAIYGADLTSYIMTDFAFGKIESILEPLFPIGKSISNGMIEATIAMNSRWGHAFTCDYEDFNSQHSTQMMQLVCDKLVEWCGQDLTPDQRKAAQWVKESLAHSQIVLPNGDKFTTTGTLLSGWRLTTFMNTVLNWLYATYIGLETRTSLHSGDDALLYCFNVKEVVTAVRRAKECGIRIQTHKTNYGGEAEFLRQVQDGKEAGTQYLARGISTLTHGRTESEDSHDISSLVEANLTRINEVIERLQGEERKHTELYRSAMIEATAKALEHKVKCEPRLIRRLYLTQRIFGGVNDEIDEVPEKRICLARHVDRENEDDVEAIREAVAPGVNDLTNVYATATELPFELRGQLKRTLTDRITKPFEQPSFNITEAEHNLNNFDVTNIKVLKHAYGHDISSDYGTTILKGLGSNAFAQELLTRLPGLESVLGRLPVWMTLAAKLAYVF